jgi:hypothetical protein
MEPAVKAVGCCEMQLNFRTGALQTKAASGDGDVSDGGGIYISGGVPDLVILIVNSSNSVVGVYPDPNPGVDVDSSLESVTDETSMRVKFTGLDEGVYSVYAFANTEGYWPMSGQGVLSAKNYLAGLTTKSAIESLKFKDLFGSVPASVCPNDDDNLPEKLPLSAKGTVNVSSLHTGEVTLAMKRCVAKVTAEFINNTVDTLKLYDYTNTIVGMCPNSGYVIEGTPDYPEGTIAGNIMAAKDSLVIPAKDTLDASSPCSVSMSWYVFPSSGPYTCDIGFTLFKGDPAEHTYTYSDLPVHDDHAVSIPSLARNRHLHIVTKISKGTTVSFNFEVSGWGVPIVEEVWFN